MTSVTSRRSGRFRTSVLGVALLGLVLTACGGGETADVGLASLESDSTVTTSETVPADTSLEDALLELTACMRDEGIDIGDPTFNADGSVDMESAIRDPEIDPQSEEFQGAMEACGDALDGVALAASGGQFDMTAIQDAMVAMAQCLRDQGFDVDDPDVTGFGPQPGVSGQPGSAELGGPFGLDFNDPAVAEAMDLCSRQVGFGLPGTTTPGGGNE